MSALREFLDGEWPAKLGTPSAEAYGAPCDVRILSSTASVPFIADCETDPFCSARTVCL